MEDFTYVLVESSDINEALVDYLVQFSIDNSGRPSCQRKDFVGREGDFIAFERYLKGDIKETPLYRLAAKIENGYGFIIRKHDVPRDPVDYHIPWGEVRQIKSNEIVAAVIQPINNREKLINPFRQSEKTESLKTILETLRDRPAGFPFKMSH